METLPNWFWIMYSIFLFVSLITGLIGLVRQWKSTLSAFTIALSLLAPLVSFVYSIQRSNSITALEYLIAQLKIGDLWAIFITVIFLCLITWNLFILSYFIMKLSRNQSVKEKLSMMKGKLLRLMKKLPFSKHEEDVKSEGVKSESK
ncbi:hypothetical protein [Oceanobacillus chungangensis]|uniref:Uncharacterized protein n=1 Tax=Oceanobacillus chungangensis TaxID=1229152 RepID=A0A3D8PXF0_9BACI|nr:hypothetical protein [Oceanobacillus chungangensis]RDW19819.1 hypothetical protein CWR45_07065 [Oceanobacillus chungangensis]